jgi:hypothetical protein
MSRLAPFACLLGTLAGPLCAQVEDPIAVGDAAWEARAEGQRDGHPSPEPIGHALTAYEAALAAAPASLEARWKLQRALFFLGEHVLMADDARLEVFAHGRALGEEGLAGVAGGRQVDELLALPPAQLRAAIDEPTATAELLFWTAVHTGLWGRTRGKLASAREGVAAKIRDYATASIALDDAIENGGGHRVLGRLNTEAPHIPFFTGWIDRSLAVRELETCLAMAPQDLTTRFYLGEALIDFVPRRRQEGLRMLREVVTSPPDPAWLIEELKAIADARAVLARVGS